MESYTIKEIVEALQENSNSRIDNIVWWLLAENDDLRRDNARQDAELMVLRETNLILQQIAMVQKKGE